ncbi:MAG: hypothetical protein ACOX7B_11800 [Christensenellales bacterium]|jgi:hypothetical protein
MKRIITIVLVFSCPPIASLAATTAEDTVELMIAAERQLADLNNKSESLGIYYAYRMLQYTGTYNINKNSLTPRIVEEVAAKVAVKYQINENTELSFFFMHKEQIAAQLRFHSTENEPQPDALATFFYSFEYQENIALFTEKLFDGKHQVQLSKNTTLYSFYDSILALHYRTEKDISSDGFVHTIQLISAYPVTGIPAEYK